EAADERHREQNDNSERADAHFQKRINPERISLACESRIRGATQAQSAHVKRQQQSQRNSRRPNHQLKQLKPYDLVDQSCTAASSEQEQKDDKHASITLQPFRAVKPVIISVQKRSGAFYGFSSHIVRPLGRFRAKSGISNHYP